MIKGKMIPLLAQLRRLFSTRESLSLKNVLRFFSEQNIEYRQFKGLPKMLNVEDVEEKKGYTIVISSTPVRITERKLSKFLKRKSVCDIHLIKHESGWISEVEKGSYFFYTMKYKDKDFDLCLAVCSRSYVNLLDPKEFSLSQLKPTPGFDLNRPC